MALRPILAALSLVLVASPVGAEAGSNPPLDRVCVVPDVAPRSDEAAKSEQSVPQGRSVASGTRQRCADKSRAAS